MLTSDAVPITGRLSIHWEEQLVPVIEAAPDTDLASAIGIVHAHLRMGQCETARPI